MQNEFNIEVLEDGTIKIDSGSYGQQEHLKAEAFMRSIAQAAGGTQTRKAKSILGEVRHQLSHAAGIAHRHGH